MKNRVRVRRRGLAVLMVLGLLAITLAVAYALVRSQATLAQLDQNRSRQDIARDAASAGLRVALREMHLASWGGIHSVVQGQVDADATYSVRFVTGDDQLQPLDPQYGEYPYRVTLISTGFSNDPADPAIQTTYEVRAVVQLVRRHLSAPPSVWTDIQQYVLYQWEDTTSTLQAPVHIRGRVRLGGPLELLPQYPSDESIKSRYLTDLHEIEQAGQGDHRPLSGPLELAVGNQDTPTMTSLTELDVAYTDTATANSLPLPLPQPPTEYQLYPGGLAYTVPVLDSQYGDHLEQLTLEPDAVNNPLGVWATLGTIYLDDDVTIRGTLLTGGSNSDIHVRGENVRLESVALPSRSEDATLRQLPVLLGSGDLQFDTAFSATVRGFACLRDKLEVPSGDDDAALDLQGGVLAGEFDVRGRSGWAAKSNSAWQSAMFLFLLQEDVGQPYFPNYVESLWNLPVQPLLTLQRDSALVTYHWHDWTSPLWLPHPEDPGLRWEVVRWQDQP